VTHPPQLTAKRKRLKHCSVVSRLAEEFDILYGLTAGGASVLPKDEDGDIVMEEVTSAILLGVFGENEVESGTLCRLSVEVGNESIYSDDSHCMVGTCVIHDLA